MRRNKLALVLLLVLAACSSEKKPSGTGESLVGKPATISHVHGLGVDAAGTLYVATHFGLVKRAGNAWTYASADQSDHMGFSLHAGDAIMYRSGHSRARPSLGVESSSDGAEWKHLSDVTDPPVDFHAMTVSFADSKTLWGSDSGGRGTFRSTDGGKTWTVLKTTGLGKSIYVLSGPAEANTLLAGTASGLFRSADGGTTWKPVSGAGGGWVIGVAADPSDAKHVLASTQRGLKITKDGGKTWIDAGPGIPKDAEIANIAISPNDGKVAYAADSSVIYTTSDGGTSWTVLT